MTTSANVPDDLLYNQDHDWARITGEKAIFGITHYAQEQLGEIVFWDGAEVGQEVVRGESYTELESVKAVSDVVAPLSGRVTAVNDAALQEPESINADPYGAGWLVEVTLTAAAEVDELLAASAYRELVQ